MARPGLEKARQVEQIWCEMSPKSSPNFKGRLDVCRWPNSKSTISLSLRNVGWQSGAYLKGIKMALCQKRRHAFSSRNRMSNPLKKGCELNFWACCETWSFIRSLILSVRITCEESATIVSCEHLAMVINPEQNSSESPWKFNLSPQICRCRGRRSISCCIASSPPFLWKSGHIFHGLSSRSLSKKKHVSRNKKS